MIELFGAISVEVNCGDLYISIEPLIDYSEKRQNKSMSVTEKKRLDYNTSNIYAERKIVIVGAY